MKNIGIVCEYNPFHNGHMKQLKMLERSICLMSGNFVQRGEPAIVDKYVRARAAVACGASLVLELPITYAIASAERFADGAVEIFSRLGCVDGLCFGSEEGDINIIMSTAKALLQPDFSEHLRSTLDQGVSFPAARQAALTQMGLDSRVLERPNDILAVEYCKALVRRNSSIEPITIKREGCYHTAQDENNPSASFLRTIDDWQAYVPKEALEIFKAAPKYRLQYGQRAYLARLRSMEEEEFETLPYGSEGLSRKLMRACRQDRTLEEIIATMKSKRYTHTRIMRLLLCAFLGITHEMMQKEAPYVRVLAFDEHGRKLLRMIRDYAGIPVINAGQTPPDREYWRLERRAGDLYGLFCEDVAAPASERNQRVFSKV